MNWICQHVLHDDSQAAEWYRKAAEQGNATAEDVLLQSSVLGSSI